MPIGLKNGPSHFSTTNDKKSFKYQPHQLQEVFVSSLSHNFQFFMPVETSVNGQRLFQSAPYRAHKRVEYTGHAVELPAGATQSDAHDYMTRIATQSYSAECAPFALRLETITASSRRGKTAADLEGDWEEEGDDEGEGAELQGDNGEFSAGAVLASCLRHCDKLYGSSCKRPGEGGTGNVLLVVTRRVHGCFVVDAVQSLKYAAIRQSAQAALQLLNQHLAAPGPQPQLLEQHQHQHQQRTVASRTLPVPLGASTSISTSSIARTGGAGRGKAASTAQCSAVHAGLIPDCDIAEDSRKKTKQHD